jgi:hypothetical protein
MTTLQRRRELLRRLYGFEFPEDCYRFWDLANRLKPLEPLHALGETLGVVLTGPLEVLAGRFDHVTPPLNPLLHWRYWHDPPEFFTVAVGGNEGSHWGYFLDAPPDPAGSVAHNHANDLFELIPDGNRLFEAVRFWLEESLSICHHDAEYGLEDPAVAQETSDRLARLREALLAFATADRPETGDEYIEKYRDVPLQRQGRVVARTRDGMGIVVPPELYRPLSLKDRELWRRLSGEQDPVELVEEARQALRDGFPGTALKLGRDLWSWPKGPRAAYAFELLDAAYAALGRDILRRVLQVHHDHRDRPWLDVLHQDESC